MVRLRETRIMGIMAWAVVLNLVAQAALGREAKLTIYPQKVSAEVGKYLLLPPPASMTDGDAVPLYGRAIKARPGKTSDDRVQQYMKRPIDTLPADQVEQVLKAYVESFKYAAQAGKCRECRWPAATPGMPPNEHRYAQLGLALRLWARYEISQENHEGALLAMQTGMAMSEHLARGPHQMQFLVGVGIAAGICKVAEEFVQMEDAPNLHGALASLPRLIPNVEEIMKCEKETLAKFRVSDPPTGMTRAQFESELKQAEERLTDLPENLRVLAKRMDRDLALLQSIEAIRSYAGSHDGQLPQILADIKEAPVPNNPITGEPFRYTRTGATAVLELPVPAGGEKKDELRYEITVKN